MRIGENDHNDFDFFLFIIRTEFAVDLIYKEFLDSLSKEDLKIGNLYRTYSKFGTSSYSTNGAFFDYADYSFKRVEFEKFFYECIRKEKQAIKSKMSDEIQKRSPNETIEYLNFRFRTIIDIVLQCNEHIVLKPYAHYIVVSLKEILTYYFEIYKDEFDKFKYQYFYNYIINQEDSNSIADPFITFRQHKDNTMHLAKYKFYIERLFVILKEAKFISGDTNISQFLTIFGVNDIENSSKLTQVTWKGTNGSLRKLIQDLYGRHIINSLGKVWEVTGVCFVGENDKGEVVSFVPVRNYNPIGGSKYSKDEDRLGTILSGFFKEIN